MIFKTCRSDRKEMTSCHSIFPIYFISKAYATELNLTNFYKIGLDITTIYWLHIINCNDTSSRLQGWEKISTNQINNKGPSDYNWKALRKKMSSWGYTETK